MKAAAFNGVEGRPVASGTLLRAVDISKNYGGVRALTDVSFDIAAGEVLALAGENGSGKSTLIRIIAGVESSDHGQLFIDGADWTQRSPSERIEAGIQIIYQDFALFPNLTAGENIWLPQQLHDGKYFVDRGGGLKVVERALKEIDARIDVDRAVADLPVSQKQLVAIARAIVHDARLIIMDEPTTALTHREVHSLFGIIRTLAARGKSFIFVTHKLQEIWQICERVIVLRNGRKTLDAPLGELNEAMIAHAMTGRELAAEHRSNPPREAKPLLTVRDLCRSGEYQNISLALGAGEVLGLAGLLGSGRTAVAKGLFGLPPPETGSIMLNGEPLYIGGVSDAVQAGIAYVPEDRLSEGLFLAFSIADNIVVRAIDRLVSNAGWLTRTRKAKEAERWIERLAIKTPSGELPVSSLSGGNQQRVVLAKWMASHPRILILNRPTVGIDVGSKSDIHRIILELASREVGIIVVSDDIPELMRLCDRILVMRGGRIVAERETAATSEAELLNIVSEVRQ
jgi:simple sugar transport system ATP-binding protein